MPFKPYKIDESFAPSQGGSAHVRPGPYLLEVAGVRPSREDHPGEPYFMYRLRIADGAEGHGQSINHTGTWKEGAQFSNASLLAAIGVNLSKLQGREAKTYAEHQGLAASVEKAIMGKKLGAQVADGEVRNGRQTSDIIEFFPEAEFANRRNGQVKAQATAPAVAAPAAPSADASAKLSESISSMLDDDNDSIL